MSFQFHHKDPYGRKAGKGATSSFNARDIADEAERKPSACRHVKEPKPPTLLFGVMPSAAVKKAYEWAAGAKDKIGRKLRPDGLCIVAGVVSVPAGFDQWNAYKKAVIDDLLKQHGDRLLSVIEHTDEAYPHMHYYMVPRAGERMEVLHEGLAARNLLRDAKKTTGEQNIAYKEAMEKFQTDFYEQVSRPFGLLRDGPKKARLSRPEWRAQQAAAKLTARMTEAANAQVQKMLMDGMTNAEGKGAEYFAQVKAQADKVLADNLIACEAREQASAEKAKAETQAAAVAKEEANRIIANAKAAQAKTDAKIADDLLNHKSFVARVKTDARHEGLAEGKAASTPLAVKALEGELQRANARAAQNYNDLLKEKQRVDVGAQTVKLKDAEIGALKSKLQALNPAVTQSQPTQNNAPAPKV